MPSGTMTRSLGAVTRRVPGLRGIPVVSLLAAAQVALLAREHLSRLSPPERRRLVALVRSGRGGRSRLSRDERRELEDLLDKLDARLLMGEAVHRLSPVPLPRRLVYGPGRRPRR